MNQATKTGQCDQHHIVVNMAKQVTELHTCILGDPTDEKSEGLRGVVQRHSRTIGGLVKLGWLLAAGLVTAALAVGAVKLWP